MVMGRSLTRALKLAAPVVYGRLAFVNLPVWRRSSGALR